MKMHRGLAALLTLALVASMAAIAHALPTLPTTLYGCVQIADGDVPNGTTVSAWMRGAPPEFLDSGFVITYLPGAGGLPALPEAAPPALRAGAVEPQADPAIRDVLVTNLRDKSFSVTWRTDVPSDGWLEYGTTPALGQKAYDDRGSGAVSLVHQVTLLGLTAETAYYYLVHSGGTVASDNGSPFQVTTAATSAQPPPRFLVYGQVETAEGAPAEGALVRVWLTDGKGGPAKAFSTLVEESGYWNLALELTDCTDYQLELHAFGSGGGDAELTHPACDSYPAPTKVLSGVETSIYLPLVLK